MINFVDPCNLMFPPKQNVRFDGKDVERMLMVSSIIMGIINVSRDGGFMYYDEIANIGKVR